MQPETTFFQITTLAPVHVGCDQVYEPTAFAIDDKKSELIHFDPFRFVAALSKADRDKFSRICLQGTVPSLLDIYKFMRSQVGVVLDGERVAVCPGFVEHYNKTLNLAPKDVQQNLNNFSISRTASLQMTGLPYLPGSSIKGALRTAILNLRNNGKTLPPYNAREAKKMEKDLLKFSQFETDPFRLVKVSDFMPTATVPRKIVYGVDCRKWPSKKVEEKERVYQILEVIEPGVTFLGSITVITPHAKAGIKQPVTMAEISKAVQTFFGKEKSREDRELSGLGINPSAMPPCFARIGRHSGAECCTVEGRRQIRIMQGKGKPAKTQDHANTIWLAADSSKPKVMHTLRPFGWVELKPLSAPEAAIMQEQHQAICADIHTEHQRLGAEKRQQDEEFLIQREAAQEKARQEAMRQAEEERAKAGQQERWDGMTQSEKDLACIRKEDMALRLASNDAKDPMPNIWPRVATASTENQKKLAAAIMERWQAEKNWTKKQCSKKQWDKVQKVKAILGLS